MNFRLNISQDEGRQGLSFTASLLLHAVVFISAAVLLNLQPESRTGSNFVQVTTSHFISETVKEREEPAEEVPAVKEEEPEKVKEELKQETAAEEKPAEPEKETAAFYSFNENSADTSALKQVYSEKTLNVSLKYPAGWTYIDQNVKNKLDGVTFWMSAGSMNPPPYVHLEVKEKYLFNPSRYKYESKRRNFTIYYNEPEEMAGQVSQIFYIRTETDEDYSLKLIIKGKDAFKAYQPQFFGMIKTFKFGSGLF